MSHQAKKRFGQNFLKDKNLLKKIVQKAEVENLNVVEIGPGQGALTAFLAESAKKVTAYEIDYSLKHILDPLLLKYENLEIIYEDFMNVDLSVVDEPIHIVANVPYYITTPILFKALEEPNVLTATMMIQKEVCDRLLAKPKDPSYNALSIVIASKADAFKVMDVKKHMFHPVPNVDSAVIRIVKKTTPLLDEKGLLLVKAAFTQKRKTLVNNWHQAFSISKIELEKFLENQGFIKNIRAEYLSLDDFIKISKEWTYDL